MSSFTSSSSSSSVMFLMSPVLLRLGAFRELSLQVADEEEQETLVKKNKKKKEKLESGGEHGVEHWVMKRQKLRARKEEEAKKRKRTVFVGNLPVGCTKKVRSEHDEVTTQ